MSPRPVQDIPVCDRLHKTHRFGPSAENAGRIRLQDGIQHQIRGIGTGRKPQGISNPLRSQSQSKSIVQTIVDHVPMIDRRILNLAIDQIHNT